jgi:hypothetical protein
MMTNELLTREDFLPAGARASGRQVGQQLMILSVFIFNGSALISESEYSACSQTLHVVNSQLLGTGRTKMP